jgi:HD-GYP domain-containing protein (c-di-GMP phosphodiesterase class II)
MASDRPYRRGLPWNAIRQMLIEARGSQLQSEFVDAFLNRMDQG